MTMPTEPRAEDIEVFSESITHFFSTSTGMPATVRSTYLLDAGRLPLWNDFNGLIDISGDYAGSIAFCASHAMLTHVLLKMGESVFTDDRQADIVGEIANTMAGRARRHFGEGLAISPPRVVERELAARPAGELSLPYAIPLDWLGYTAHLVVQLDPRRPGMPRR